MFYVDIVKMLNIATRLVTSCSLRGEYNLEASMPEDKRFTIDAAIYKELTFCRAHRNKRGWFNYCKPLCMRFEVGRLSNFYEPNLLKIIEYTKFVIKNTDKMLNANSQSTSYGSLIDN
jgi:hypothetical protein